MRQITQIMDLVSERLAATARGDVVAGDPIVLGDYTIVAVSRVTLGLGAGGGAGETATETERASSGGGRGTGGGTAGGARVRPMAVVVFSDAGVKVLTIPDRRGHLDKLMEKLPAMIERFRGRDEDGDGDEDG